MILYKSEQRVLGRSDCLQILSQAEKDHPDAFERARDHFVAFVDPAAYYKPYPTVAEINAVNSAFTEWVLFDFDFAQAAAAERAGEPLPEAPQTLVEAYAQGDATVEELARTQFFSTFWVIAQDPKRKLSVMRETRTCRDFEVSCDLISTRRNWTSGTVNARIASVGGRWVSCGRCLSHDSAPSEPQPACMTQTDPERDSSRFIELVRELEGVTGRFVATARAESFWPA